LWYNNPILRYNNPIFTLYCEHWCTYRLKQVDCCIVPCISQCITYDIVDIDIDGIDIVWVSNGFDWFFQWNQWIPKWWIQSLCNAYQHIQYVHRCSYTCTCQKRACCHMCACVFIMVWLVVWTLINANSKSMLLLLLLPCAVAV